jgi:DNA sulfur modification protein DndC
MKIAELVLTTKAVIQKMYLDDSDTRDWAVAYSGGKDSTAVMGLVVSVMESLPLEKRWRRVHAVMSDTEMENPLVKEHMHKQARLINEYASKKELPLDVTVVSRETRESYMVKVLGMGYPLPMNNGKARWCTDRLKIKPQDKYLKAINPSFILTGVRKAESSQRANSIEKWSISEFIGNHVSLKKAHTFNPIVHWTVQDVWKFLEMEGISWGSTLSVRTIYRDATGECGFTNPEGTEKKGWEACGARHGCWNCPVILKDRSTENMSEKHTWLEPLTYWRTLQLKIYGNYKNRSKAGKAIADKIKLITKCGYNRKGVRMEDGQGTLTLAARQFLFAELLETEKMVNRLRRMSNLDAVRLISDEEIKLIKEYWEEDLAKNPHVLSNQLGLDIKDLEDLIND